MSKENLQKWLLENTGFQKQFRNLLLDSVTHQFEQLENDSSISNEEHNWSYLLMCASLLAQSDKSECQIISLRIAQYCLESSTSDAEKDSAAVILDILANRPTIALAEHRNLLQKGYADRLPFFLLQDWTRRYFNNSIALQNSPRLEVNKFQSAFWEAADTKDWISISAPTSAGKSFIVGRWFAEFLRKNPLANVVYVVPTRALIQQVQRDLEELIKTEHISATSVVTIPTHTSISKDKANVFVFTQERFHMLLGEQELDISFDLLVIDEAQKIGDNYRGVLLQQAIETVTLQNNKCKVLFASPMTNNPELFLEDAPEKITTSTVSREDVMVSQNLIWASQVPGQPKIWNIELLINSEPTQIGKIKLPERPAPASKRLPFVAHVLGDPKGGNIIYVNGAADAESTAKQLYDLMENAPDICDDSEIKELIALIKKTVHKKYFLSNVLRKGVAFHYGNMPLLIRTEIERLFSTNKIKYLICTSTLIEGVNMPCHSIFVRGPKKGKSTPMSHSDFWNLAGRAGRWGKEFQGNIVCVDANKEDVWKNGTPKSRTKSHIYRTSDKVLNQQKDLLNFIDSGTPRDIALDNPNLEYVFSYLVSSHIQNEGLKGSIWAKRYDNEFIDNLDAKISSIRGAIGIPDKIILRNPGISPLAIDALLDYFDDRTNKRKEPIENLIPLPPEDRDAVEEYSKILLRINKCLSMYAFGFKPSRAWQLSLIITNWMRGYPLAQIISNREKFYTDKGEGVKLPTLIRGTMDDVEEYARFKAPKFLSCYVDVLKLHIIQSGREDLLERILDLNLLLEFGVSHTTQLSLVGLGLSRSSAVALSEFITKDNLDEEQCLDWLKNNDWITEDMSEIVRREISTLLKKKNKINK
jgi:replicative superfamily II helicase